MAQGSQHYHPQGPRVLGECSVSPAPGAPLLGLALIPEPMLTPRAGPTGLQVPTQLLIAPISAARLAEGRRGEAGCRGGRCWGHGQLRPPGGPGDAGSGPRLWSRGGPAAGGTAGSQGEGTGWGQQCLGQVSLRGGHRHRCRVGTGSDSLCEERRGESRWGLSQGGVRPSWSVWGQGGPHPGTGQGSEWKCPGPGGRRWSSADTRYHR